jgi:hypothetical protein
MTQIFADQTALAALCRRHHIRRLSLFGSRLKGTSRPDSDVVLLVEFQTGDVARTAEAQFEARGRYLSPLHDHMPNWHPRIAKSFARRSWLRQRRERRYQSRFLAKACPDPDLRYVSNASAWRRSLKAM